MDDDLNIETFLEISLEDEYLEKEKFDEHNSAYDGCLGIFEDYIGP
jgi:hypothetical protein